MKKYLYGALIALLLVLLVGGIWWRHQSAKPSTVTDTAASTGQPAAKAGPAYAALGDSVAAGVGLAEYSDASACDRTKQAYPGQLAAKQHYQVTNLACSGATFAAGLNGSQDVNRLPVTAQITQLFGQPKPALVSITAGANDLRWTELLQRCYMATCGTAADKAALNAGLQTVAAGLRTTLGQIQNKYGTAPPRVLVTGYYQIFPQQAAAGCSDLSGIEQGELAWARSVQTSLNDTLRTTAAAFPFAGFVPVSFEGHELCTADPWLQGLTDKQPFHPTEAGQANIAKNLEATLKTDPL
jgi:lysophospholipase L1-like esterase